MSNIVTIEGREYTLTLTPVEQPKPVKPKYVMTEADWQRVSREGFDCVFADSSWRVVRKLKTYSLSSRIAKDELGNLWKLCEVRREVGHRQPHFGGPYPGHPYDSVLAKRRDGKLMGPILASLLDKNWNPVAGIAVDYFITEYIVLEEGGK